MQILEFSPLFKTIVGKMSQLSDWWIIRRYKKFFTGHKNRPRNYKNNPVTAEERKTHERMKRIVPAYRALKSDPEQWAAFLAEFKAQRRKKHGIESNPYAYFVHREMERLKKEGDLAADPSQYIQDWSLKKRK